MSDPDCEIAARGWSLLSLTKLREPSVWLAAGVYTLGIFIGGALVVAGFIALFRFGFDAAFGGEARVDAAKVFFPALVAVVGGPFLVWRVITGHWAALAAKQQAQTGQEAHYTTLFTKAVEQLGATREVKTADTTRTVENIEVRLGAVYALERIAHDSERDHWPIMEVLCAYIRQNARDPWKSTQEISSVDFLNEDEFSAKAASFRAWARKIPRPRADIQAALTVIGRRPKSRCEWERKREADPSDPGEYRLDLRDANLQKADFRSLNFDRAIFDGAYLDGANLRRCKLERADVANASLINADVSGANIEGAWISGSNLNFADLDRVSANKARIRGCKLNGIDAYNADFSDVNFGMSEIFRAAFYNSNLSKARFWRSKIGNTSMVRSNISYSNFQHSTFVDVDLSKAFVYGASLQGASGISSEILEATYQGDAATSIPSGVERPANWLDYEIGEDEILERIAERNRTLDDEIPF